MSRPQRSLGGTAKLARDKSNRRREELSTFGPAARFVRGPQGGSDRMDGTAGRLSGRLGPFNQQRDGGSASGGGGGGGGGASGGGRGGAGVGGRPVGRSQFTTVRVEGFSGGVNRDNFVDFVKRHVRKKFHISKFLVDGNSVYMTMATHGEAQAVAQLRRQAYNKDTIVFSLSQHAGALKWSDETKRNLHAVIMRNYQPASQDLDLSRFKSLMHEANVHVTVNFKNSAFVAALLKVVQEILPELAGLRLCQNEIQHLSAFSQLHLVLPRLTRLDLSSNEIGSVQQLDNLRNLKTLQQLFVFDNPFVSNGDTVTLKSEIARKFPSLQALNGEAVNTMQFALPVAASEGPLLPPEQGDFVDQDETRSVVAVFLQMYFARFDELDGNGRDQLLHAYADNACFSVVTARTPARHGARDQPNPEYQRQSRNLKLENMVNEGKEWERRLRLLQRSPANIVTFLRSLPGTQHQLNAVRVDMWQYPESMPPLLFIFLHGDYTEMKSTRSGPIKRSFDRTFVLKVSPPDSAAARAGWPVQITNDALVVRSYSGRFEPPAASSSASTGATIATVPLGALPIPASDVPPLLVQQLMQATGMNQVYAAQCLRETGLDYNKAISAFQTLQATGQLPVEAFTQ